MTVSPSKDISPSKEVEVPLRQDTNSSKNKYGKSKGKGHSSNNGKAEASTSREHTLHNEESGGRGSNRIRENTNDHEDDEIDDSWCGPRKRHQANVDLASSPSPPPLGLSKQGRVRKEYSSTQQLPAKSVQKLRSGESGDFKTPASSAVGSGVGSKQGSSSSSRHPVSGRGCPPLYAEKPRGYWHQVREYSASKDNRKWSDKHLQTDESSFGITTGHTVDTNAQTDDWTVTRKDRDLVDANRQIRQLQTELSQDRGKEHEILKNEFKRCERQLRKTQTDLENSLKEISGTKDIKKKVSTLEKKLEKERKKHTEEIDRLKKRLDTSSPSDFKKSWKKLDDHRIEVQDAADGIIYTLEQKSIDERKMYLEQIDNLQKMLDAEKYCDQYPELGQTSASPNQLKKQLADKDTLISSQASEIKEQTTTIQELEDKIAQSKNQAEERERLHKIELHERQRGVRDAEKFGKQYQEGDETSELVNQLKKAISGKDRIMQKQLLEIDTLKNKLDAEKNCNRYPALDETSASVNQLKKQLEDKDRRISSQASELKDKTTTLEDQQLTIQKHLAHIEKIKKKRQEQEDMINKFKEEASGGHSSKKNSHINKEVLYMEKQIVRERKAHNDEIGRLSKLDPSSLKSLENFRNKIHDEAARDIRQFKIQHTGLDKKIKQQMLEISQSQQECERLQNKVKEYEREIRTLKSGAKNSSQKDPEEEDLHKQLEQRTRKIKEQSIEIGKLKKQLADGFSTETDIKKIGRLNAEVKSLIEKEVQNEKRKQKDKIWELEKQVEKETQRSHDLKVRNDDLKKQVKSGNSSVGFQESKYSDLVKKLAAKEKQYNDLLNKFPDIHIVNRAEPVSYIAKQEQKIEKENTWADIVTAEKSYNNRRIDTITSASASPKDVTASSSQQPDVSREGSKPTWADRLRQDSGFSEGATGSKSKGKGQKGPRPPTPEDTSMVKCSYSFDWSSSPCAEGSKGYEFDGKSKGKGYKGIRPGRKSFAEPPVADSTVIRQNSLGSIDYGVRHSLILFTEGKGPHSWYSDRLWSLRADLIARVFRSVLIRQCFGNFIIAFETAFYCMAISEESRKFWSLTEGEIIEHLRYVMQLCEPEDLPKDPLYWLKEDGDFIDEINSANGGQYASSTGGNILFAVGGKDDPEVSSPKLVKILQKLYPAGKSVSLGSKSMLASEVILRLPVYPQLLPDTPLPEPSTTNRMYYVKDVTFPVCQVDFLLSGLNAVMLYVTQCGHGRNENTALYIEFTGKSFPPLLFHRPSLPRECAAPSSIGLHQYMVRGNHYHKKISIPGHEGGKCKGRFNSGNDRKWFSVKTALQFLRSRSRSDWNTVPISKEDMSRVWFLPPDTA